MLQRQLERKTVAGKAWGVWGGREREGGAPGRPERHRKTTEEIRPPTEAWLGEIPREEAEQRARTGEVESQDQQGKSFRTGNEEGEEGKRGG